MVNPYGNLLEEAVLAASPMELTNMLFEKLLSEIEAAAEAAARGEVARRNASASQATEIVIELMSSLDDVKGGELSRSLRQLYTYVMEQLVEGNLRQEAEHFRNAEKVVAPLALAWKQLAEPGGGVEANAAQLSSLSYSGVGSMSFSG